MVEPDLATPPHRVSRMVGVLVDRGVGSTPDHDFDSSSLSVPATLDA